MNNPDTLDEILERMWGGGIDFATSDDFKNLSPDEHDKAYVTYLTNLKIKAKKQLLQWRATTLLEMIGEDEPMVDIIGKELGSGDIAHLDFDGLENAKVSVSIVTANGRNNLRAELRQQIEQQTKEAGK